MRKMIKKLLNIKCIKCGLRFKDREDPEDNGMVYKELCWNCRFVWKCIGMTLDALGRGKTNREIIIQLKDVVIRKKRKSIY